MKPLLRRYRTSYPCVSILALSVVLPPAVWAQIIISEVHPTPSSGEPEWVECANIGVRPQRLIGWMLCDSRSCVVIPDITIAAGSYAILTPDAIALSECRSVPADVVVAECRLPSLNNTTDRVELRGNDSLILDSTSYDMRRHIRGRSLERCGEWVNGRIAYADVWSASTRRDSASCGILNSCVVLPDDVRVLPLEVHDSTIAVIIRNAGSVVSAERPYAISIGPSRTRNRLPPLDPGRSAEYVLDRSSWGADEHVQRMRVRVVLDAPDDRPDNDTLDQEVTIGPLVAAITISEMMAEPADRQAEYVEIWNGTTDAIDLSGWTIDDASQRRAVIMPPAIVLPGGYLAVSSDTTIAMMQDVGYWTLMRPAVNINASGDVITLRTPEGLVIDRVSYDDAAHAPILTTRGRSLERRAPWSVTTAASSWTTCTHPSGGTPGRSNSIGSPMPVISGLQSWPDPCSASSSSASYPCVISWEQPIEQGVGRLRIFRLDGMEVAELFNGELIGRWGSATWDVRDDVTHMPVAIGTYVAVLECTALFTTDTSVERCLVNVGQSDLQPRKR